MRNILLLCAALAASPLLPAQILINEVGTGSPDFIELVNAGQSQINLAGYKVRSYETRGNSGPCSPPAAGQFGLVTQWAFPVGTPFPLAPGAVLALVERGIAGNRPSPEVLETGVNILFHETSDCEVWLERPSGVVADYMVFGSVVTDEYVRRAHAAPGHWPDTPVIRPRRGGWVVARVNQPVIPDSNSAADWIVDGFSGASPGQPNANVPTGITAFGKGVGVPGTCSALAEDNWATALPTLTWRDFDSGTPRIGGQLQLSVSSGILGGPVGDMLVLASAPTEALALCAGGPTLLLQPPWVVAAPLGVLYDGLGAGDLPDIPIPRRGRLRGTAVYAQVFFAEAGATFCSLRSTQGLQILIR